MGPASPSYLQYATFWDAGWYRDIATFGYPTVLPVDAAGHVQSNPWAFLPVYPAIVRAIQDATGAPFDVTAVAVSVLAGGGAVLVLHRLLSRVLSPSSTLTAVVIVCVAPVSPLFQIAYAESLQTLLLLTALLLLVERRYVLLAPVVVVMAFTRPSASPSRSRWCCTAPTGSRRPAAIRSRPRNGPGSSWRRPPPSPRAPRGR